MRLFLVGILLLVSATYLNAEYEDDDLDKCKAERKKCLEDAGDDHKAKLECLLKYGKCRPRPTGPRPSFRPTPPTPPDFVVKCKNERIACMKVAGDDFQAKLKCIVEFNKCLLTNRPTPQAYSEEARHLGIPDFIAKCKAEAKQCMASAGDDKDKKRQCFLGYLKCVRENRPRPTPPAYVVKCKSEFVKCLKASGDDKGKKKQCYINFRKCLYENRPTRKPRPSGKPSKISLQ